MCVYVYIYIYIYYIYIYIYMYIYVCVYANHQQVVVRERVPLRVADWVLRADGMLRAV